MFGATSYNHGVTSHKIWGYTLCTMIGARSCKVRAMSYKVLLKKNKSCDAPMHNHDIRKCTPSQEKPLSGYLQVFVPTLDMYSKQFT